MLTTDSDHVSHDHDTGDYDDYDDDDGGDHNDDNETVMLTRSTAMILIRLPTVLTLGNMQQKNE